MLTVNHGLWMEKVIDFAVRAPRDFSEPYSPHATMKKKTLELGRHLGIIS
jgi:hypothetical protein